MKFSTIKQTSLLSFFSGCIDIQTYAAVVSRQNSLVTIKSATQRSPVYQHPVTSGIRCSQRLVFEPAYQTQGHAP